MDSDKRSAQVERLEVVDTGRRRRWSEDERACHNLLCERGHEVFRRQTTRVTL
jgi:hypothetical protein